MVFGAIGGSASLGSATGYLFIDATGVRRGLESASQAMAEFNARTQATSRAMGALTDAQDRVAAAEATLNAARTARMQAEAAAAAAQQQHAQALTNYANSAKHVEQLEKRLSVERNRAATLTTRYERATKKLQSAQEAYNRAAEAAIAKGTKRERAALEAIRSRLAAAKDEQKVARIAKANADARLRQAKLDLQVASQVGASSALTAKLMTDVRQATLDRAKAQIALDKATEKTIQTERDLTRATQALDAATKQAIASIDQKIVKNLSLAQAEARRAQTMRDNARATLRQIESDLRLGRITQEQARIARDAAAQQLKAANTRLTATSRALASAQREFDQAVALQQRLTSQFIAEDRRRVASAIAAAKQIATAYSRIAFIFGAGLTAGLIASTASFAKFEEKLIDSAAISEEIDENFEEFKNRILDLSTKLGVSASSIAEGLHEIAQAGFEGFEAFTILEAAARAAAAGHTTVAEAAKPIISVINAYGVSVEEAARISDILFVGVTEGIFTFEELSRQLADNVPLASQLGVSLAEVAASYIVLTKQGNSLAESTTQINGIFRAFLKPTEALERALRSAGFESGYAAIQTLGLGGAMMLAWEAADGNFNVLAKMFPLIRGMRGQVALSAQDFKLWAKAIEETESASDGLGASTEVLNRKMQGTAFQFRQVVREIQRAVILFGEEIAPSLLKVAKYVGNLAEAFSDLPQPVKSSAADIVIMTAMLSLISSVGVRVALVLTRLIRVIVLLRYAVIALRIATMALVTTFGLLGGGIILAAAAGLSLLALRQEKARRAARAHKEALEELVSLLKSFDDIAVELRMQGTEEAARSVENLRDDIEIFIRIMEDAERELRDWGVSSKEEFERVREEFKWLGDDAIETSKFLDVMESAGFSPDELRKRIEALRAAMAEMTKNLARHDIDVNRLSDDYEVLVRRLFRGEIGVKEFNNEIERISKNLHIYKATADDAQKVTEGIGASMRDASAFFKSAEDELESFDDAVRNLIESGKSATHTLKDIKDPTVQAAKFLGMAGQNAFDVARQMQKIGMISLTDAEIQALNFAGALDRVQQRIVKLDEAIQQNRDDLSMWESRIEFIDFVLGDHNDTLKEYQRQLQSGEITVKEFNRAVESGEAHVAFAELNKLVEEGAISQKEANRIRADAIWIIERAKGGIRDERLEMLRQIPILRKYIEEHDRVHGAYKGLTDEQKGFIAALQDESVQLTLNTAVTLKFLEALGAIPEGVTTRFLADMSQANPLVAAFLEDIGFIDQREPELTVRINDASAVLAKLHEIRGLTMTFKDPTTISLLVKDVDQVEKVLEEFMRLNGATIAETDVGVEVTINGVTYKADDPENPINKLKAEIFGIPTEETKQVDVVVEGTATQKVEETKRAVEELDGKTATTEINVSGNASEQVEEIAQQVESVSQQDVVVSVKVADESAKQDLASLEERLHALSRQDGWIAKILISDETAKTDLSNIEQRLQSLIDASFIIRVSTEIDDTGLNAMGEAIANLAAIAPEAGQSVGQEFVQAATTQLARGGQVMGNASRFAIATATLMSADFANRSGRAVGAAFDYGIAWGIYQNASIVTQAATYVATAVFNATMRALRARSPSRRGIEAGQSFVQGLSRGISDGTRLVIEQAKRTALAAVTAFDRAVMDKQQQIALGSLGGPPIHRSMLPSTSPVTQPRGDVNVHVNVGDIVVNGGATNEETAEVIWRRLEEGLTRWSIAHEVA